MYITLERELDEPFSWKEYEIWITIGTEYDVHSMNEYYQTEVSYDITNIECYDEDGYPYSISQEAQEAFIKNMGTELKLQLQDFAVIHSDFTDDEIQDEIRVWI